MTLSIIVPVYNVEKSLNTTIKSILSQTFSDFELILVDDGSIDESGKICDDFAETDSRIKVIHKQNEGVSAARNDGIDASCGQYIAFVDGDDIVEPELYQRLITEIRDCDTAFCRFYKLFAGNKKICFNETNLNALKTRPYDFKYIIVNNSNRDESDMVYTDKIFGSVWRSLFKKDIIEKYNIRFNTKLSIAEDRIFLLEYLMHCNSAAVVDDYLYGYSFLSESSATQTLKKYQPTLLEREKLLVNKQIELIRENGRLNKKEQSFLISYLYTQAAFELIQNEIRYNGSAKLNELYKDKFFKKALKLKYIIKTGKSYPKSKTVYLLLAHFKCCKILKKKTGC